jgi:cytochrome c oxidase cbb3-type subunit I/II
MKTILLIAICIVLILGVLTANKRRNDAAGSPSAEEDLKFGERIYQENCAACHGDKGDGKGPQAEKLNTKPRNFTTGIYKFRSRPSGSLPLDQDIFRTITLGVRGTSMLAQLQLSEQERWALVRYLKAFAKRFNEQKAKQAVGSPPSPSPNAKLVALGKSKYEEAGCAQCHGSEGKGDGPSAKDLKDDWGNPISPTDLTLKPFKSGSDPEDLYRTLSTGLNGTPMPSYTAAFSANERWALVSYILSIANHERPRGTMGLVGEEVEGMRIDMRAAMAGMMGDKGMMDRKMRDMMKDMMRK